MTHEHANSATLSDGTKAPGKLGDAIKVLSRMDVSLRGQIRNHGYHLSPEVLRELERQIGAIKAALPVLNCELNRRKAEFAKGAI